MVDSIITFHEGDDILASETNQNNQFLLDKLTANAEQLDNYIKQQLTTIQSNLSSIQATLQNNINTLNTQLNTINTNLKTYYLPNYSAGFSISSGWTATKDGWVNWNASKVDDGGTSTLSVNNVAVGYHYHYKYRNDYYCQILVSKGDKITITGKISAKFYPCKGA